MEYKSIYDSVDAFYYTGKNLKEANDFCGGNLSWSSVEDYWEDDTPPEDLMVIADFRIKMPLLPGDYIIRLSSGNYMILLEEDFEMLFEEVK